MNLFLCLAKWTSIWIWAKWDFLESKQCGWSHCFVKKKHNNRTIELRLFEIDLAIKTNWRERRWKKKKDKIDGSREIEWEIKASIDALQDAFCFVELVSRAARSFARSRKARWVSCLFKLTQPQKSRGVSRRIKSDKMHFIKETFWFIKIVRLSRSPSCLIQLKAFCERLHRQAATRNAESFSFSWLCLI